MRFVLVGLISVGIIIAFSAVITTAGSHTILDPASPRTISSTTSSMSDNNTIAIAGEQAYQSLDNVLVSVGSAVYVGCRSITTAVSHFGNYMISTLQTMGTTLVSSISSTIRNVSNTLNYGFRLPGRAVKSLADTKPVSSILRPADDTAKPVPVISSQTSPAVLALLDAKQRKYAEILQQAQVAANQNLNGEVVTGSAAHGGYPLRWDLAAQDSTVDSWGMYNRECVSYAAWKVYQTYGSMPFWGGIGNANQWVANARNAAIPIGYTPLAHSVAISMHGYYGHAMWVEAVDGDRIYVSQYNYDLRGHYSEMWVSSAGLTYIYFGS